VGFLLKQVMSHNSRFWQLKVEALKLEETYLELEEERSLEFRESSSSELSAQIQKVVNTQCSH